MSFHGGRGRSWKDDQFIVIVASQEQDTGLIE